MPAETRPISRDFWIALAALAAIVTATALAARLGALFTSPETSVPGSWYSGLTLPALQPPGWAFGAAWTTLYALMAVAAWRAWRASDARFPALPAMSAYGGQLALNALWPFVFFGLKAPCAAIPVIAALFVAVLLTARIFWVRDQIAGLLLVPYVLWLAFASYLNIAIAASN